MKTIILGMDPGYGACGFAVLEKEGSDLKIKTYGVIKTRPQHNFPDRLHEIAQDFEGLLKKYKPHIVAIEDLFFVQNVSTGIQVAEVRGVLLYLAQNFGCRIVEPKPVEIKSIFTGNGKASKPEIQKMARLLFDLEHSPKVDDAADAIAAGYCAGQNLSFS